MTNWMLEAEDIVDDMKHENSRLFSFFRSAEGVD